MTRTGYLATKAVGGNGRNTLLVGLGLAIVGIVLATQGTVIIGLTGTVVALVGLYLIAIGAWGIHKRPARCDHRHHRGGGRGGARSVLGAHRTVGQERERQRRVGPA